MEFTLSSTSFFTGTSSKTSPNSSLALRIFPLKTCTETAKTQRTHCSSLALSWYQWYFCWYLSPWKRLPVTPRHVTMNFSSTFTVDMSWFLSSWDSSCSCLSTCTLTPNASPSTMKRTPSARISIKNSSSISSLSPVSHFNQNTSSAFSRKLKLYCTMEFS